MLCRYKLELRADFQQYYTLNLDKMGKEYRIAHAADLAVMLPQESRVMRRIDPSNAWGWQEHLLADLVNRVRWLQWAKTPDGAKNRNHPTPIEVPKRVARQTPPNPVYKTTEYTRRLSLPRQRQSESTKTISA
ncbi:MAG: DUF5361 domain-containing protein [Coriobacteriia bacterium]|nr:DUF5361 domain-containing protein [Coriobacteriia bacterium]